MDDYASYFCRFDIVYTVRDIANFSIVVALNCRTLTVIYRPTRARFVHLERGTTAC